MSHKTLDRHTIAEHYELGRFWRRLQSVRGDLARIARVSDESLNQHFEEIDAELETIQSDIAGFETIYQDEKIEKLLQDKRRLRLENNELTQAVKDQMKRNESLQQTNKRLQKQITEIQDQITGFGEW